MSSRAPNMAPIVLEDIEGGNIQRNSTNEQQSNKHRAPALGKSKCNRPVEVIPEANDRSTAYEAGLGGQSQVYDDFVNTRGKSSFLGGSARTGVSNSQTYKDIVHTEGESTFVGGNLADTGNQEYKKPVTTDEHSMFVGGSVGKGDALNEVKNLWGKNE